ncbi:hypothetical protein LZV00_11780 [Pseudomonas kielensis]|nr:hypothetical protein [Pseudomonas kielensis]UZM16324.1 hypothetical protein LZV00_11780 [Pseudomonas kielensis]
MSEFMCVGPEVEAESVKREALAATEPQAPGGTPRLARAERRMSMNRPRQHTAVQEHGKLQSKRVHIGLMKTNVVVRIKYLAFYQRLPDDRFARGLEKIQIRLIALGQAPLNVPHIKRYRRTVDQCAGKLQLILKGLHCRRPMNIPAIDHRSEFLWPYVQQGRTYALDALKSEGNIAAVYCTLKRN